MRVLLDECLPRKLKGHLPGHDTKTVPEMGWAGTKDGPLLQFTRAEFDAFLTIDRGVPNRRRSSADPLVIVALTAPSNRLADLEPLMSEVRERLSAAQRGEIVRVGGHEPKRA